jgi:hypothetical protein
MDAILFVPDLATACSAGSFEQILTLSTKPIHFAAGALEDDFCFRKAQFAHSISDKSIPISDPSSKFDRVAVPIDSLTRRGGPEQPVEEKIA